MDLLLEKDLKKIDQLTDNFITNESVAQKLNKSVNYNEN